MYVYIHIYIYTCVYICVLRISYVMCHRHMLLYNCYVYVACDITNYMYGRVRFWGVRTCHVPPTKSTWLPNICVPPPSSRLPVVPRDHLSGGGGGGAYRKMHKTVGGKEYVWGTFKTNVNILHDTSEPPNTQHQTYKSFCKTNEGETQRR